MGTSQTKVKSGDRRCPFLLLARAKPASSPAAMAGSNIIRLATAVYSWSASSKDEKNQGKHGQSKPNVASVQLSQVQTQVLSIVFH
jgi:hypothetical protein